MSCLGQMVLNSLLVGTQQKIPHLGLMLGGLYESRLHLCMIFTD